MIAKYGFLTGLGLVLALLSLWLVEPQTKGGQALLAVIVFGLVNGIGALVWRKKA
jgi:hypothetical protein